jgi:hypothetical protein
MKTTAWAAFCTDGYPKPFIHDGSIRATRVETQAYIGGAWALSDETARLGWKRAYRAGWRCILVEVSILCHSALAADEQKNKA